MTTPALPLQPNDELVGVAWIASIPDIILIGGTAVVATQLPADVIPKGQPGAGSPAAWVKTGFVTVSVIGGNPDDLLPVNRPVMQVDCYATVPGSNKPPWWQAAALATAIRRATWDRNAMPRPLGITANGVAYPTAVVRAASMLTAFRRIYDDAGDYARYQGDLSLNWVTVNERIS